MADSIKQRILVYLGRKASDCEAELAAIAGLGLTTVVTSRSDELETLLRTARYDVLIWMHSPSVDKHFEKCLQKSRNFSLARPTKIIVLAQSIVPTQIEPVLRLGALWVYNNSKVTERWLPELRGLLKMHELVPNTMGLLKIKPVEIDIRCYCRIGKVEIEKMGFLSIETNLIAKSGETVVLKGAFEKSLDDIKANFILKNVDRTNLYYRYENHFDLEPAFKITPARWKKWLQDQSYDFTAPKSKVLWITNRYSFERESFFDKTLFSVYTEQPKAITLALLRKLSARIVIVDDVEDDVARIVDEWVKEHSDGTILVVKNGIVGSQSWVGLHCFNDDGLGLEFTQLLREFLKRRISKASQTSKFLTRESEISRAYFALKGTLTEISTTSFSFVSNYDFVNPTMLRFDVNQPSLKMMTGLYGRVVGSEFLADHKNYRVFCEWIPNSDTLGEIIPNYKELISQK